MAPYVAAGRVVGSSDILRLFVVVISLTELPANLTVSWCSVVASNSYGVVQVCRRLGCRFGCLVCAITVFVWQLGGHIDLRSD